MSLRGRPGTLRDSHARSVRGEGGSRWFASMVGVAQLVRAPGCGPGGRGFESPRSPHRIGPWATPAPLAQLVEHRTLNPQVLGSSPRGCTKEIPGVSLGFRCFTIEQGLFAVDHVSVTRLDHRVFGRSDMTGQPGRLPPQTGQLH